MKTPAIRIAISLLILFFMIGCQTNSDEVARPSLPQEWTISRTGGAGQFDDLTVYTVKGHGRVCYVFSREIAGKNSSVVLWCEVDERDPQ